MDETLKSGALTSVHRTKAQGGHLLEAGVQAGLELGDAQARPDPRGLGLAQLGAAAVLAALVVTLSVGAVLASTFTVMIVFLPLLLVKGQTGQTFLQFALVVVRGLRERKILQNIWIAFEKCINPAKDPLR